MELNQLRYFQTVARFQQMTKAAEELHISQSSLSKTISMLERDVGAKLFDRLGNRIILNRTGQTFLKRVDRALLELEDAVREVNASDCGSIHFAASIPGLCTSYLDAFLQSCPQVMLRQSIMGPEEMTAALESGELDCALTFSDISSERITCETLVQEEMLMLVSRNHPLADYEKAPLSVFAEELFVCNNADENTRQMLYDHCRQAGFVPHMGFDGNELELAFKLVAENHGVMMISSLIYHWMMSMEIITPPLHYITPIEITEPRCQRALSLAMLDNHYVSKTTEQFIAGLRDYFKQQK